jgi:hypothetical protein
MNVSTGWQQDKLYKTKIHAVGLLGQLQSSQSFKQMTQSKMSVICQDGIQIFSLRWISINIEIISIKTWSQLWKRGFLG